MVGVVEYLVLFFEFEGWGGVGVDDLFHVCLGVVSVLSSSEPDVAGQNVVRCAVGEACEEELLLSVVGKAPEEELVSSFVVALVVG